MFSNLRAKLAIYHDTKPISPPLFLLSLRSPSRTACRPRRTACPRAAYGCAIWSFTYVNLESGRQIHRPLPRPKLSQAWRVGFLTVYTVNTGAFFAFLLNLLKFRPFGRKKRPRWPAEGCAIRPKLYRPQDFLQRLQKFLWPIQCGDCAVFVRYPAVSLLFVGQRRFTLLAAKFTLLTKCAKDTRQREQQ